MNRTEVLEVIRRAKIRGDKELHLNMCSISEIPREIGDLTNLETLILRENELTELPLEIGSLSNLSHLDLRKNSIELLPDVFGGLLKLTKLYSNYNRISSIPESLCRVRSLAELYLSHNQITELPDAFENLENLRILNLGSNDLANLPQRLGNLRKLEVLRLGGNRLRALPTEIGGLSSLVRLDLSGNGLFGLPQEIKNLSSLEDLNLMGNRITQVEEAMGELPALTDLYLSHNPIARLPKRIGRVTHRIRGERHDKFLGQYRFSQFEPDQLNVKHEVATLAKGVSRAVGTHDHDAAKHHIIARISDQGFLPYTGHRFEARFRYGGQNFSNILAIAPGRNPRLSPILFGAHYDTCPDTPGADDNAAAVAALLVSAQSIWEGNLERSVIFAFFDSEEPPYFITPSMGSYRFFEEQRTDDIHCAVIMDLIGHDVPIPGLEDLLFITGMESNKGLEAVIQNVDIDSQIRILPTLNRYVGDLSDHHVFRANEVPYLFLSCGRWEHYHEPSDTPEKLNYAKIEAVARFLTSLAIEISKSDLEGEFEGYDSSPTEIRFLQDNLMPVVSKMGFAPELNNRSDIDRLASMMTSYLGI